MIKLLFSNMGMIIGNMITETDDEVELEEPVLVITQKDRSALVPILALAEENTVVFKKTTILSERVFTPIIDLQNEYNKMFGAGIVQVHANRVNFKH